MGGVIPFTPPPLIDVSGAQVGQLPNLLQQLGFGAGTPGSGLAGTSVPRPMIPASFVPPPVISPSTMPSFNIPGAGARPATGPAMPFPRTTMGAQGLPGMGQLGRVNPGGVLGMADDIVPSGGRIGTAASKMGGLKGLVQSPLSGGRMGMLKGAGIGLGIGIAGNKLGEMAGGNKSFLGRFLQGAGTGGSVGMLGGPWVAAGGAILGGIVNAFGGKPDKPEDPIWLEEKVLDRAGFGEQDKQEIRLAYDILKSTDPENADSLIGEMIMADIGMRNQVQAESAAQQQQMLSSQALAAQFFQPFTQQMLDSAQQRYNITESVAANLPPEYRDVARTQNAASLDNANRVATSYAAQAQLIPMMAGLDYQKNLADQLSQQQAAQVMSAMYGGGQQAGAGSLTDLARQAALAESQG